MELCIVYLHLQFNLYKYTCFYLSMSERKVQAISVHCTLFKVISIKPNCFWLWQRKRAQCEFHPRGTLFYRIFIFALAFLLNKNVPSVYIHYKSLWPMEKSSDKNKDNKHCRWNAEIWTCRSRHTEAISMGILRPAYWDTHTFLIHLSLQKKTKLRGYIFFLILWLTFIASQLFFTLQTQCFMFIFRWA